jgi:hypothetical protein
MEYQAEIDIDSTIRDNISIRNSIRLGNHAAGTRSDVLTSKMIVLQLSNKDDG